MAGNAHFVEGNAGHSALISDLIAHHAIDAIIHFSGSIVVPESASQPLAYYANNMAVARDLMEAGVWHLIFLIATVYGEGGSGLIAETRPTSSVNSYERSTLMTE